jgi:hypothetical protein
MIRKMKMLLTIVSSIFVNVALSQDITLRAQFVQDCYHVFDSTVFHGNAITAKLSRITNGEDLGAKVDPGGEYLFNNLVEADYKLIAGYGDPFNSDTVIHISRNLGVIRFCLDSKFRPLHKDEIESYEQTAHSDIKDKRLTLYRLSTDYPLSAKELKKITTTLKSKYGIEYVFESGANLYSREGFITLKRYQAYNNVVQQHLDQQFGTSWREMLKTVEISFPLK